MELTLDSSVIIAALRKQETMHQECRLLLQQVSKGTHRAFESVIVLVEVTAAIRRRTGLERLAREARESLLALDSFVFLELTESRMKSAARIAERIPLKGMDAIVAQIAEERGSLLVTLDGEFADRVGRLVAVKDVGRLETEVEGWQQELRE